MAWFGQGKDTIEWDEFRDDVLFYKWPKAEVKKGSKLIIRPGQKAIFFANGKIEGIFEEPGSYDIASEIVPFLSTLKGVFELRGDSGMRAEVYFVNSKELTMSWGTRQRLMIPTPEVPAGIPVGCNGNLVIVFRDYQTFIDKVAGIKDTFAVEDVSERIFGELNPILAESILGGQPCIGVNALIGLQQNSRRLGKTIADELDKELLGIGLGVEDVNILSFNYPEEVQRMAEKAAGQAFVGDVGRYAAISMADGMAEPGGGNNMGAMAAQMAMGAQMAQQMGGAMGGAAQQPAQQQPVQQQAAQQPAGDRFCPKCRKMVSSKFCPDCGSETV